MSEFSREGDSSVELNQIKKEYNELRVLTRLAALHSISHRGHT